MAATNFYVTFVCTYPAGATQVGQYTTIQAVTPWGQSTPCYTIREALMQAMMDGGPGGSEDSGPMGNYMNNGVTRGLSTNSQTVPSAASYFQTTP
jgi:hypothetical protein